MTLFKHPLQEPELADQVLDRADLGLIVLDSGRRILRWNLWMVAHSSISVEKAVGRTLSELFARQVGRRVLSAIEECFVHAHTQILSPSLNRRPFPLTTPASDIYAQVDMEQAVTIKPLVTESKERYCLIQIVDVSQAGRRERFLRRQTAEMSRLIDQLRAAKDAATEANLAKSEFLTHMSHELRSPLNAIIGFSQLLEMGKTGSLTMEQQEFITYIDKAGQHLLKMITDILDLSRIEAKKVLLEPVDLDLNAFIADCINGVRSLSKARAVTISYAPSKRGGLNVRADRTRLAQILLNLLSNAIKYNRPNGHVDVKVTRPVSSRLRITVTDTGFGIPFERQSEVFQSFNRLGAEFGEVEGTGIGLALSRNLAELMGGAIGFESLPGAGSSFWVDMPMALSGLALVHSDSTPETPDHPALPPFTILHIEDNPVSQRLVEALMSTIPGAHLIKARTGEEGLELALSKPPDVILLDIHLPGINGFEVLTQLHAQNATRAIPVVAVSASALSDDIARGLTAGFHTWLAKPLALADLMAVLVGLLIGGASSKEVRKP